MSREHEQLSNASNPIPWTFSRMGRMVLGVVAIFFGLAIGAWVLYNSWVERLPEYSGGFLTFGISPMMIGCGVFWVRTAYTGETPTLGDDWEEDWQEDVDHS